MPASPYLNEAAFDAGKARVHRIAKGLVLNVTYAELAGATFREDMYEKLKVALEADDHKVEKVVA